MKKAVAILSIGIIFSALTGYFSFYMGFNLGVTKGTKIEQPVNSKEHDTFIKVDYPLIDIYFDTESEWLVIDRTGLFGHQEKFSIIRESQGLLQFSKEGLRVLTFPAGRGTTPEGYIYVYKNNVLIKEVPYIEIYFENEIIKNAFQQKTKNEVEDIIKNKLPPRI